ncbi:hypothetical protein [Streptomyces chartreusis]
MGDRFALTEMVTMLRLVRLELAEGQVIREADPASPYGRAPCG